MNSDLDTTLINIAKIDGWLETQEIRSLYTIASTAVKEMRREEFIIEIGSWKGKSTITLALACKNRAKGKLLAIDPCKGTSAHAFLQTQDTSEELTKNLQKFGVEQFVEIILKTSKQAFNRLRGIKSKLIFVDGDHAYPSVLFDVTHWSTTLVNNGYLLLHDTVNHSGPRTVFFQILLHPRYRYLGTYKDLSCFQKVATVSIRQWLKKIYAFLVFKALFKIYTPAVS